MAVSLNIVFAVQSAMNYVYAWILLLLPRSIEDRPTAYGAFRKGAPNNAMGHSLQDRHPRFKTAALHIFGKQVQRAVQIWSFAPTEFQIYERSMQG